MIVADTNLVSYLLIRGDRTPVARRVWRRDPLWVLPPLWRAEFLNVLAASIRAGVVTEEQAIAVWHSASALFEGREHEPGGEAVLRAAVRYGLSAYDAQFVVVAEDLKVRLVTGDREVLAACPDVSIAIEDFGK